jgi:hypothetical protein
MIVGLCRGVWREFLPNARLWDLLLVSEMPSSFVYASKGIVDAFHEGLVSTRVLNCGLF